MTDAAAAADARFTNAALALARRGLGRTAPNPAVGALLVRDGAIVARGFTQPGGRPHAEAEALRAAGAASRGATLYVTLEPCCHHGRTPPCADAIAAAGVARVVGTIDDPDPRVAGRGYGRLREAGVAVTTGVCAEAALRANLGHALRVTTGRPMVTLKLALTADGFAADSPGAPRLAITGAAAAGYIHMLRAMHDAILVGAGTVAEDDPLLTVRLPGIETLRPLRVMLDSGLRVSPGVNLIKTAAAWPTLVIAAAAAPEAAAARLIAAGAEVARVAADAAGCANLGQALRLLGGRGVTRVLCEGGPVLADALIAGGFADAVIILEGPSPLGRAGRAGLTDAGRAALADPRRYRCVEARMLGADRLTRSERIL